MTRLKQRKANDGKARRAALAKERGGALTPRPGWAVRLALAALALGYGVLAWGSGIDRVSRQSLSVERMVPSVFRAQADVAAARLATASNDGPALLLASRAAVQSNPFDRDPAAYLGTALLSKGDVAAADDAFRVAALFGWRQPITQLYWMEVARASGDFDLAALRIDAILRYNPNFDQAGRMLVEFGDSAEGRRALAKRLALKPEWLDQYLWRNYDPDRDALLGRTAVLENLARIDGPLGCDRVARMVSFLLEENLYDAGERMVQAHCPGSGAIGGLRDNTFAQFKVSGTSNPFGWQAAPDADVALRKDSQSGLTIENSGISAKPFISQPVRFDAGEQSIRWDAIDRDGGQSDRIDVSIDCGNAKRPSGRTGRSRTVTVPDCAVQQLRIWVTQGTGPVTIRQIATTR